MQKPTFDNAQLVQLIVAAPAYTTAAAAGTDLVPGQWTALRDETGNKLVFVVKYLSGSVVSGSVSLS
jgi:hypothetical protein